MIQRLDDYSITIDGIVIGDEDYRNDNQSDASYSQAHKDDDDDNNVGLSKYNIPSTSSNVTPMASKPTIFPSLSN